MSHDGKERRRKLYRDLKKARAFADRLGELFAPVAELRSPIAAETVVCRCEEVTWRDVQTAWEDGADSTYRVKLWARAGMGRCQGRLCGGAIAALLADR